MSQVTLHPTPALSVVAREQFRMIGLAVRRDAVGFLLLTLALSLVVNLRSPTDPPGGGYFTPLTVWPALLLGFLAASAVWKGSEPSRRGYDLAMPLDAHTHVLLRVASGWAWAMALMAVFLLWGLVLAWYAGLEIGVAQESPFVGSEDRLSPELLDRYRWVVPGWQWLTLFTGTTITYLLASIAVLASDRAWRWIGWAIALGLGVLFLIGPIKPLESIFNGPSGIFSALTGIVSGRETIELTYPDGSSRWTGPVMRPNLSAWLVALPLWLGVSLVGTLLAARPRR